MERIKQQIDSADVVSFDIFDTLLSRKVAAPVDVFTVTQEYLNQESDFTLQDNFRPLRIKAEREARLNKVRADVTLDDIYMYIRQLRPDYPESLVLALMDAEIQAERSVLVRNHIADAYDYAKSRNKKLAIVSDMYLPKWAIRRYLEDNGINEWDTLIVSCEDHVSKASGTAFVALKEQFPGKKIVHIGDNYHDDIVVSRRYGINAVHVENNIENVARRNVVQRFWDVNERRQNMPENAYLGEVQQSIIDGLIANDIVSTNADINRVIGFGVLGPLLLGFSQWLHESLKDGEVDKVLFLARDGKIIHRAYNTLYGTSAINNEYIYGSRRALVMPSLKVLTGEDIRTFAQLDRGASLSATLETFNLSKSDPAVKKAAKHIGLNLNNDRIDASNALNVETLLLSLKDKILETIGEERETVMAYLDSLGFQDKNTRIAVCDIGWNGSVRTVIESYVGREVTGYYLGLRNVEKTVFAGKKIKGYFDARKDFDWSNFAPVVAGGVEVIEFLFSNPDQGPIKKIVRKKDGIFDAPENKHDFPDDRREMIREIQSAAMDFINVYQESMKSLPRSLWLTDRHSGLSNIVDVIDRPTRSTAYVIGNSPYATSVGSHPELIGAPTKSNLYYRLHWRALKREWAKSFWGQGFKKNAEARGLKHHRL